MPRDIMSHMAFVMLEMVDSPCTHALESEGICLTSQDQHQRCRCVTQLTTYSSEITPAPRRQT